MGNTRDNNEQAYQRAYVKTCEYGESDYKEEEYFIENRLKRAKRRKCNRIYTIVISIASLIFGVLLIVVGIRHRTVSCDGVVVEEPTVKMYTQEEVDFLLAEAREQEEAKASGAAEEMKQTILDSIQSNLEDGKGLMKTLRPLYPDKILLASGGTYHFLPIRDNLKKHGYLEEQLTRMENGELQYTQDGQLISHKGIDVSKHQGKIDWNQVAQDGVEYAFIRVAYRGYGETGKLYEDETFKENIEGAIAAGIKVGVYIYSQAITEEELREEAMFVLEKIAPYKIECPVVYDVERVASEKGRMNHISVEERTKFAALFCDMIQDAGYRAMIYHNMEMATLMLNLEELEAYDKWFAYYNDELYYPYHFSVWQYTEKGRVAGVKGEVDLNISFGSLWEE